MSWRMAVFAFVASDDAARRWLCEHVGLCAALPPRPPALPSAVGLVPGGCARRHSEPCRRDRMRHDRSLAVTEAGHCHAGWERRGPLCPGRLSGPVSITSCKSPFPDSREVCDDQTHEALRDWPGRGAHVSRCSREESPGARPCPALPVLPGGT